MKKSFEILSDIDISWLYIFSLPTSLLAYISFTFGGKKMDELFITTAVRGFSEEIDNDSNKKYDGMLFKVQTKIKGFDTYRFAFK